MEACAYSKDRGLGQIWPIWSEGSAKYGIKPKGQKGSFGEVRVRVMRGMHAPFHAKTKHA